MSGLGCFADDGPYHECGVVWGAVMSYMRETILQVVHCMSRCIYQHGGGVRRRGGGMQPDRSVKELADTRRLLPVLKPRAIFGPMSIRNVNASAVDLCRHTNMHVQPDPFVFFVGFAAYMIRSPPDLPKPGSDPRP